MRTAISIVLILLGCAQCFGQLGKVVLTPPLHIIDLDKGRNTYHYELTNQGDTSFDVSVSILNWSKDEENNMVLIPSEKDSLDQWIIASPLEFTVPAKKSQVVRFAIRPAVELPEGEHRAAFVFRQKKSKNPSQQNGEGGIVIQNLFELKSAIYASVGDVVRTGSVIEYQLEPKALRTRIASEGNAHVRPAGNFQIWKEGMFPGKDEAKKLMLDKDSNYEGLLYKDRLRNKSVQEGQTHWIEHSFKDFELDTGRFLVFVHGRCGDKDFEAVEVFELSSQ